ncbi:Detected protein of unknown function [Hibiscus syriacus]|uniref:Uncharacterized protein n=1 Tax=Hibiscus syriacus TaxID=106335 RepID=A0A6A2WGA0_HIBSY|nr:Detected protein of unknown function [Hibiscus syriacus]
MKPFHLPFSLLVLFIFLSTVQGIRLTKSFESTGSHSMEEGALMKNSNGVIGDDIILCKQGHCTGKGRKHFTATTTSTPTSTITSKEKEKGENKASNPTSKLKSAVKEGNGRKQEKLHDDITDIVEMDYSPAKRKPPVHN